MSRSQDACLVRTDPSVDLSTLNRGSKEPLHKQLAAIIRSAIEEGHYRPGDRIEAGRDFARWTNLSHPTVTRAFRDLAAEGLVVRKVGSGTYVANRITHAERERTTIGVFHYDCFGEFFQRLLRGIQEECRQSGTVCIPVFPENYADGNAERVSAELIERGIKGIVACPSLTIDCPGLGSVVPNLTIDEAHRLLLRRLIHQMPVVLMDVCFPDVACDVVMTAHEDGAYQLAQHLLELGHRRIAFVSHSIKYPYTSSIQERIAGMKRALREAYIEHEEDWVVGFRRTQGPLLDQEEHVRQAVNSLLDRPRNRRPTAIMCVNDTFAPLVLGSLRARGVEVPEEMSVTGFDDLAHVATLEPPLTTVAQALERIGHQSVRMLIRRVQDRERPATHMTIDGILMVRESTGRPADRGYLSKEAVVMV
jgi:DNA-binding LacI/PurR family transcriptional regulator